MVYKSVFMPLIMILSTAGALLGQMMERVESSAGPLMLEQIGPAFEHPWGLVVLSRDRQIVTERSGRLWLVENGQRREIPLTLPIAAQGQGGLLDVAIAPGSNEQTLFVTFSEADERGRLRAAVARIELTPEYSTVGETVIFRQTPAVSGGRHFGSRIVFAENGDLFVTFGDRGVRDPAQDNSNHIGTIIRITSIGQPSPLNPTWDSPAQPEIWSYGHRNIQGATMIEDALYTVEHGARGGDELNRPHADRNYGWPVISYGRHYSGARIGVGTSALDMEQPLHYWDPSIAPSGLAQYTGSLMPNWTGDLFVGALAGQALHRLRLSADQVVEEEILLDGFGRIRDVVDGPDGALWLITDEANGGIYRLSPLQ